MHRSTWLLAADSTSKKRHPKLWKQSDILKINISLIFWKCCDPLSDLPPPRAAVCCCVLLPCLKQIWTDGLDCAHVGLIYYIARGAIAFIPRPWESRGQQLASAALTSPDWLVARSNSRATAGVGVWASGGLLFLIASEEEPWDALLKCVDYGSAHRKKTRFVAAVQLKETSDILYHKTAEQPKNSEERRTHITNESFILHNPWRYGTTESII